MALLQFGILLFGLLALSNYILVEKPGVDGADWRAMVAPTHPSNPPGLLTAQPSDPLGQYLQEQLQALRSAL